jgi:chemotaxis protein MotA
MDIATLIGLLLSFTAIALSMLLGGGVASFLDLPSLVLVLGGTIGVTLVNQRLVYVIGAFRVMTNAFLDRSPDPRELVPLIIRLAAKARREGVVSLEE